jgi:putative addiction module antidote
MTTNLKIRKVGNSYGVILPKEILTKLELTENSELVLSERPNGFTLSKQGDDFETKMKAAERIMRKYSSDLRELAK